MSTFSGFIDQVTSMRGFKSMLALVMVLVLMLSLAFVVQAADSSGGTALLDTTNFSLAYARSLKSDGADCMIGKISVPLFDTKLTEERSLTFGLDLVTTIGDTEPRFGLGGSVQINSSPWGLGLGVAYLPGDYGWSGTVTLVQLKL